MRFPNPEGPRHLARSLRRIIKALLPSPVLRWRDAHLRRYAGRPAVGCVKFGNFRRLLPISERFGYDRGQPVDRYYIERFLACHAHDVQGRVLEVGEDTYTRRFGGARVTVCDVLHVQEGSPGATIVADLARGNHLPSNTFDCIILTQTLQFIYDARAAIATLHRILKPGGVLLATVPGITRIEAYDWGDSWYWNFTSHSIYRLLGEAFPSTHYSVESFGNVLAAAAFLYGLAAEELLPEELEARDPRYEVCITIRAVKPEGEWT